MTWRHVLSSFVAGFLAALVMLLVYGEPIGASIMGFGGHLRNAATPVLEQEHEPATEVRLLDPPVPARQKVSRR